MSSISIDSDISEFDDLSASMTSVGSSLSVPRPFMEKRGLTKTSSYPLEQVQKCPETRTENESSRKKSVDKCVGQSEIHDWWQEELGLNGDDESF